jgi:hypothetical protein
MVGIKGCSSVATCKGSLSDSNNNATKTIWEQLLLHQNNLQILTGFTQCKEILKITIE